MDLIITPPRQSGRGLQKAGEYMYQTLTKSEFMDAFRSYNRFENFGYDGLDVLFDYFEQLEEDQGSRIEIDVIAICCDFTKYDNLAEFQEAYSKEYTSIDDIEAATVVIRINDESFIIQQF